MDFASAFNTLTLMDPSDNQWYMDSGATAHLSNTTGNLKSIFNSSIGKTVTVANGGRIPINSSRYISFPTKSRPLSLNNVLVTPSIIKNLIYVCRFTRDNKCYVEFDPFNFSVKDLTTRKTILRSDNTGDLYPLHDLNNKATTQPSAFLTASSDVLHRRLAHPGDQTLNFLLSTSSLSCNKRDQFHLCSACQFAKHTKHPYFTSTNIFKEPFEIVQSDLWTSPIPSISGIQYYVFFLDHFTHFL